LRGDGGFEVQNEVQLMLDSLGPSLYVLSIDWVPLEPFQLAVATPSFVKIYDITLDCIAPIICFQTHDRILSVTFVEHDDDPFVVVSTTSSQVALGNCHMDSHDGPVNFRHFVNFSGLAIRSPYVSYSKESDLFFLSALGSPLLVFHSRSLWQSPFSEFGAVMKAAQQSQFVCCHSEAPSLHFFVGLVSGEVFVLELTDSGIAWAPIESPFRNADVQLAYFGVFPLAGGVAAIAADGYLYTLKSGKPQGHPRLEYECEELVAEENGFDFHVPASFWTSSFVDMNAVLVTEGGADVTPRFLQKHCLFEGNRIVLKLRSRNKNQAIVGVQIGFSNPISRLAPKSLRIMNRRYKIQSAFPRKFALPLKQEEVDANATVILEVTNDAQEIHIDDLQVHMAEWKSPQSANWREDSLDLRDFGDAPELNFATDVEFIAASLSAAAFEEAGIRILEMMYKKSKLAGMSRRIVLKVFGRSEALQRIWTETIKRVCETAAVAPEMMAVMWRDFNGLTVENQEKVGDKIWKYSAGGSHALVASLLS
jgi:uncharacterized protein YlaN (UPF0358 family)